MNEGDIVLAPVPQADGRIKNRPAVLLRRLPPFGDWLAGMHKIGIVGHDQFVEIGDALVDLGADAEKS